MAILLPTTTITTAVTAQVTSNFQLRGTDGHRFLPAAMILQSNFVYGSGGTTVDAYVQTSLDGGTTWIDAANFHYASVLASLRSILSVTNTAIVTGYTALDGSIAANTSKDGIFGPLWRVKLTTTGTFAGGTTLRIDAFSNGIIPSP